MEDRIPCINPSCRRTAKRDNEHEQEIICGKCFRALPISIRTRRKQLDRRNRKLDRLAKRRAFQGDWDQWGRVGRLFDAAWEANWSAIRAYFQPGERPEGLGSFLEDMGLK